MKTINFIGQTIIGVHILTRVTEGNHVPSTTKKFIKLFTDTLQEIYISESQYESEIVGSGIRLYRGTVERGGGRHAFYGVDDTRARQCLREEYSNYMTITFQPLSEGRSQEASLLAHGLVERSVQEWFYGVLLPSRRKQEELGATLRLLGSAWVLTR
jgi:hypothetical protein